MGKKLISVIVPIYNIEEYLEKCINSIINQTYDNLEIILVDDGSTDNSGNICDEYKKIDKRIKVIHKANGGLSSARNAGLDIARGDLIAFVDSDDYLESTMYEELKDNMNKFDSDISACDFYKIKKNSKKRAIKIAKNNEVVFINKEIIYNTIGKYKDLFSYSWNKMYKKKLFDNIRFPNGRVFEDGFIIFDLLEKTKKVSIIVKPLYNYVYRNTSIVNTFDINHFDIVEARNIKIKYLNNKGYYNLALNEKNKKMNSLVINLAKMKRYKIKDKEVFNKYYKELLDTNKDVKWKDANKKAKLFKIFRRPYISVLAIMYRVKDLIKK